MNYRHFFLVILFFLSNSVFCTEIDLSWTKDVGVRNIPNLTKQFNVNDFGAVADGVTLNTKAIQSAIDACAKSGGGIVTFGKGSYLTGAIFLKQNTILDIPKGTTILGSTDINDYPEIDTRVAGIEMKWPSALINVLNQEKVVIRGDGLIHGQGKVFWDSYWAMRKEYEEKGLRWIVDYDCKRPRTLLVSESKDVLIKDLTFQQAGFWTIQILYSEYCTVDGVIIRNNVGGHGPSTDGVDIDSSSKILVENCDIDCNDDNFCLKSGRDADGLRVNRPTEYVVIRNCISRAGSGLFTLGSETSGGIRNILAEGLKGKGTNVAIRLKSAMNRGGIIENIYVNDIELDEVNIVFEASSNWNPAYSYSILPNGYDSTSIPEHWTKMLETVDPELATPVFKNISISNVMIKNSNSFIYMQGSKQSYLYDFLFKNIKGEVQTLGKIEYAKNFKFENISVRASDNKKIEIKNSSNIELPKDLVENKPFQHSLSGVNCTIEADKHPEFAFYFPEMSGNLKFGIINNNGKDKWLSEFENIEITDKTNKSIQYVLTDPIIGKGKIIVNAKVISSSAGLILELESSRLPSNRTLIWSYGGASGKVLGNNEYGRLFPQYCRYNVFSVEQTAFTLYYGESMKLKILNAVMPLCSEIRLADAYIQQSPASYFESGKKTTAPALAGKLELTNNKKEYFCIYKQNEEADYNHFMLPELFKITK